MSPLLAWSLGLVLAAATGPQVPALGPAAGSLDAEGYCGRLALAAATPERAKAACLARERAARARLGGRRVTPAIARYCRDLATAAGSYVLLEDCIDRQERARALGSAPAADPEARIRCEALAATVGGGPTVLQYCLDRQRHGESPPGS